MKVVFCLLFLISTSQANLRGVDHVPDTVAGRQLRSEMQGPPGRGGRGGAGRPETANAANPDCETCQDICDEDDGSLYICLGEATLCIKPNAYKGLCRQSIVQCGRCEGFVAGADGPCPEHVCDVGRNGKISYNICRTNNEGSNFTQCANENNGIFNTSNYTCGACEAPCDSDQMCGNLGNGRSRYSICTTDGGGKNTTRCLPETNPIFDDPSNFTCGVCEAPCDEEYACGNGQGTPKYEICRVNDEGREQTLCTPENSDFLTNGNFTCGACESVASECQVADYECGTIGNGKFNRYQICRNGRTQCVGENSGVFRGGNFTCGPCEGNGGDDVDGGDGIDSGGPVDAGPCPPDADCNANEYTICVARGNSGRFDTIECAATNNPAFQRDYTCGRCLV